jgi:hypothetical protein
MMGIFLASVGFMFFSVLYVQQGLSSQGKSVACDVFVVMRVCAEPTRRMDRQLESGSNQANSGFR